MALSRAAADDKLLELNRSTAVLISVLAGDLPSQTQPVASPGPGSTNGAAALNPVNPAPHPMFARTSNAPPSSSAHVSPVVQAAPIFKLSGRQPANRPAPHSRSAGRMSISSAPITVHQMGGKHAPPFKLSRALNSAEVTSQESTENRSINQPNASRSKVLQGATRAAPHAPGLSPGPGPDTGTPTPATMNPIPPSRLAIAEPTNIGSDARPRTSRTPGRKRVMFEDPAGTTPAADKGNDRDIPTEMRYTTATLRNTTNITDEPQALKR